MVIEEALISYLKALVLGVSFNKLISTSTPCKDDTAILTLLMLLSKDSSSSSS